MGRRCLYNNRHGHLRVRSGHLTHHSASPIDNHCRLNRYRGCGQALPAKLTSFLHLRKASSEATLSTLPLSIPRRRVTLYSTLLESNRQSNSKVSATPVRRRWPPSTFIQSASKGTAGESLCTRPGSPFAPNPPGTPRHAGIHRWPPGACSPSAAGGIRQSPAQRGAMWRRKKEAETKPRRKPLLPPGVGPRRPAYGRPARLERPTGEPWQNKRECR